MNLFTQLMRPLSIKGVNSGAEWRLKRSVVIALYAAVFAFGFLIARPFAQLGVMMGLSTAAISVATITAIVASMLLLMWSFDRFIAGRVVLSPRLVRALFTEVQRRTDAHNVTRPVR